MRYEKQTIYIPKVPVPLGTNKIGRISEQQK